MASHNGAQYRSPPDEDTVMIRRLLIVTPLFYGDGSGASVYYKHFSRLMAETGIEVGIVSDRTRAEALSWPLSYFPLFPARCGLEKRPVIDRVNYLIQNILYFRLPGIISDFRPDAVVIHSSFLNHPGLFGFFCSLLMSRRREVKYFADVRDHLMPISQIARLNMFDGVIACSGNVASHLLRGGLIASRMHHIPVIQEPIRRDDYLDSSVLSEFGLVGAKYILYAGLIKESKGVDILLDAFLDHLRPAMPDTVLVLAGLTKTANTETLHRMSSNGVRVLGPLSRNKILALMANASLCVNLSPSEGMPRSSLEALALGSTVALPPGIPEFDSCCGDRVVASRNPAVVAKRLAVLMNTPNTCRYPVERHFPGSVIQSYLSLFSEDLPYP
jgi:glycosyltransferase involved in cell wall biosynthesis